MALRVVMMGTGTFALPTFLQLCGSPHQVVGLVTQPDRTGRGHHHHPHPMKEAAVERGIDVFQPDRVNLPESLDRLRAYQADIFVVAAYGQILSAELLAIPRLGAINLHASLLPKYRGAAPIQYAVWNGEQETGVTIFRIEPKLDAGPILGVVQTPIRAQETSGDVEDRLSRLAAPLTLSVLEELEQGRCREHLQDAAEVSRAPKIRKEQGLIDWSKSREQIDWHVRAMQPWPMPFTHLHVPGRPPVRLLVLATAPGDATTAEPPGAVVNDGSGRLLVQCGDGLIEILRLQPAGKRAMEAAEFLRGHSVASGARFGDATA